MGSMSSILFISLFFEWLQVHQHLCLNFGVACNTFTELQLGDHGISSPIDSWKIICYNLPTLIEDKQLEEGGFVMSHLDY